MAIRTPGAVTITSLELIVLDATATCTQPDASGGSEVMRTTLVLGESRQLSVSAGLRTFSVIAYDGSTAVARGCDTVDLIAGRTHQVDIQLVEYPQDADAGPDGGESDAGEVVDGDVPGPLNDICSNAELLTAGLSVPGTLTNALDHTATSCMSGSQRDVFYEIDTTGWTDPQSVLVSLSSPGLDTGIALREDDCATELLCVNNTAQGEQLDVPVLQPGHHYYLVVESTGGSGGNFTIGYTVGVPRPHNDICEWADPLVDGTPITGASITDARNDGNGTCGAASRKDVIFTFSVPAGPNQRARITVSNATFDPAIHVHMGSCGGTEVGCAESSNGATEVLDLPSLAVGNYWVWVEADDAGTGTFDILLELLPEVGPPGNDVCTGAAPLTQNVVASGSTVGATDDYTLTCTGTDGRDTVHEISLGAAGALLVSVTPTPSPWNVAAELRSQTNCAAGPAVACEADSQPVRRINCKNLAMGVYDLLVDGDSGASGDYDVVYDVRAPDTTFGYWTIDKTGTYTSIAGTTGAVNENVPTATPGTLAPGDECSLSLTLPFSFPYFGSTYTSIYAHCNMFLTFDVPPSGSEAWTNDCPLSSSVPNNTIAPFWDDGYASNAAPASEVWTKVEGQAPGRRWIIEYKNFDLLNCGGTCQPSDFLDANVNHQVILYENGDIEFRYGSRVARNGGCTGRDRGCSATIGIEGEIGTTDVDQIQCNTTTTPIQDGRVIQFIRPSTCN